MAKPQPSPGDLRSSRKRALEIGTDASGFPDDLPYDHDGGFPTGTPGQGGTHRDNVTGGGASSLPPQPKPFK
jgi:hypothetical protein